VTADNESARLRFLREARAAASLRHPNVASVFHLGKTGENYFYAMEFVEGETLENLIKRSGRIEVKLALEIAAQVAAGLVAVHEQYLVHRDIKPANIMVSLKERNRVIAKIIDLGLSKTTADSASQPAISMPGAFAGTPEFASPEQFAGIGADIRSDLYSLGVTLWEMITGQTPFRGTPAEVMYQHQHTPLPLERFVDIPQPIIVLLQMLLEKDPRWRFQNPTELVNALPKVNDAIKAGRSITDQTLRTITDEQCATGLKATSALSRSLTAVGRRKSNLLLWTFVALLTAGGLITIKSTFFTATHRLPDASLPALSETKIPKKSIAVLPFESLSENKSDTYFADGVQDEVLSNLAKVSQLKVISRTSVMTYRSANDRNLRSIATALGVANVVEGTVRRYGNRVRVTTKLVDARTDKTLWSDSYDRDLTDIFVIQSEIARTIASQLSAQMSPEEKQNIAERPTDDLEAYDLYLQAKALIVNSAYEEDARGTLLNALRLLEEVVRKDREFALAYCLVARAHDYLKLLGNDQTLESRTLGDAAVNEALRWGPNLPEVHLAVAFHRYIWYQDYERARVQLAIVERTFPNNPEAIALAAYLERHQCNWDKSTNDLERAIALDPRNPEFINQLANNYLSLRRYRDYDRMYDRLIQLEPDKPALIIRKAYSTIIGRADLDSYRAALESTLEGLPSAMKDNILIVSTCFAAAVYARDWKAAKEILNKTMNAELFYNFVFNSRIDCLVPRQRRSSHDGGRVLDGAGSA
jgi:serine/threonine protein kinase/Tfp pilus assembly protein PilF